MKSGRYIPQRGDLIWIDFTPQKGREQRGRRPALVISPYMYNEKTSLCICLPVTSKVKGYPFEVALPQGQEINGVILSDHIKSLDFDARDAAYIGKVSKEILESVQENILLLVR